MVRYGGDMGEISSLTCRRGNLMKEWRSQTKCRPPDSNQTLVSWISPYLPTSPHISTLKAGKVVWRDLPISPHHLPISPKHSSARSALVMAPPKRLIKRKKELMLRRVIYVLEKCVRDLASGQK